MVNDIETAINHWVGAFGAGPFFTGDYRLLDQVYRGRPTDSSISVALGWAGGVLIEFVRQNNDAASPFIRTSIGPRFHHLMFRTESYEVELRRLAGQGCEVIYTARLPTGVRCAMIDASSIVGGLVEVMDQPPELIALFEGMLDAHRSWDGVTAPVRALKDLAAR